MKSHFDKQKHSNIFFAFLVLTASCSDNTTYHRMDSGIDTDAANDSSTDSGESDTAPIKDCNPSNTPLKNYLTIESLQTSDIDAVSIIPCEDNDVRFVQFVHDVSFSGNLDAITGHPDSTCDGGYVSLPGDGNYITVDFISSNMKPGDRITLHAKSCDDYAINTSDFALYAINTDNQRLNLTFTPIGQDTYLVE